MDIFGIYKKLHQIYGTQKWWPVKYSKDNSAFEISVGAILTQNTSWKNVEKALACLNENKLLSAKAIIKCPESKLQKCLRPTGYYRQKSKKLKFFCKWIDTDLNGRIENLFSKQLANAREKLLSVWGIGPETADSILLYAGNMPIFVIDAYTKRLCERMNCSFSSYEDYQKYFQSKLRKSTKLFQEYHALIVASGKDGHQKICLKK